MGKILEFLMQKFTSLKELRFGRHLVNHLPQPKKLHTFKGLGKYSIPAVH
jgi:hypothetical protein